MVMMQTPESTGGSLVGRELARLIAGQACLHACMAGMRMASPLLALREGHSPLAVGVLLALFALTQVFLSLPAGRFADRHGLRRPVGLAVIVAVAATGMAAAWPVFPMLCLAALMTGGATGAASIALQRHAGRIASGPLQVRQVFSWLAIGPAISNFVGPFSAGLLIDYAGFRTAFLALALLAVLSWACVRSAPELPQPEVPAGQESTTAWSLLKEPNIRNLMIINWLMSSCWDVHTFVVPVLGHERDLSASTIGSILGSFAIATMVIRILMPMVAARLSEAIIIASAMMASALLFVVYPFMGSALAMGACSVVLGLALGTIQPMIMSTLHQVTPEHRHGEALGLRLMAINASSVLMPIIFGAAGAVVGVSAVFWAVGALVTPGVPLALRLSLPDRRPH
jgi:predicted MFS family arabinose efflux permease